MLKSLFSVYRDYFARRDLSATGKALLMTAAIVPASALLSPVLWVSSGVALSASALPLVVLCGATAGLLASSAATLGIYISEKQIKRDKKTITTTINTIGQTVEGSRYDLGLLKNLESRIASLAAQIEEKDDPALQKSLKEAFDSAAAPLSAVRVLAPSPAAPSAKTYVFARTITQTTIKAIPAPARLRTY